MVLQIRSHPQITFCNILLVGLFNKICFLGSSPCLIEDVGAVNINELHSHLKYEYLKDNGLVYKTNVGYFWLNGGDSQVVYMK